MQLICVWLGAFKWGKQKWKMLQIIKRFVTVVLERTIPTVKWHLSYVWMLGLIKKRASTVSDAKKFQDIVPSFQLVILSQNHFGGSVYAGPVTMEDIYHVDNHFHTMASITSFLHKSYYCVHCEKGFKNNYDHQCLYRSADCNRSTCQGCKAAVKRDCPECCKSVGTNDCFFIHLQSTHNY